MIDDLRHLDETSNKLLKGGHVKDAIDCFDLALQRRKELLGPTSHAFHLSCINLAATFMQIAMDPNNGMAKSSRVSLLRRAEELSQNNESSKVAVWYNLAKLYQLKNDLKLAYKYLKMALVVQSRLRGIKDRRISIEMHLNMSSILSRSNKHKMALRHARTALALTEGCLANEKKHLISCAENNNEREDSVNCNISSDNLNRNWSEILAISYYNVGTQYEHLQDYEASCYAYECGEKVASLLGDDKDIKEKLEMASKHLKKRSTDKLATNNH